MLSVIREGVKTVCVTDCVALIVAVISWVKVSVIRILLLLVTEANSVLT